MSSESSASSLSSCLEYSWTCESSNSSDKIDEHKSNVQTSEEKQSIPIDENENDEAIALALTHDLDYEYSWTSESLNSSEKIEKHKSNVQTSEEKQLLPIDENENDEAIALALTYDLDYEYSWTSESLNSSEKIDKHKSNVQTSEEKQSLLIDENGNNEVMASTLTYNIDHDRKTTYLDGKDEQMMLEQVMDEQVTLKQLKSVAETTDCESLKCELLNKHESNVSKIFTMVEEISLLNDIEKDEGPCICKSCAMTRLKHLAYHIVCKRKKPYPKSWNRNRQAESQWLNKFEERHKERISKFPLVCTSGLSQVSMSQRQSSNKKILTPQEKQSLPTKEKCVMTKMLSTDYNLDDKAIDEYLCDSSDNMIAFQRNEQKCENKISKSSLDCTEKLSQKSKGKQSLFKRHLSQEKQLLTDVLTNEKSLMIASTSTYNLGDDRETTDPDSYNVE